MHLTILIEDACEFEQVSSRLLSHYIKCITLRGECSLYAWKARHQGDAPLFREMDLLATNHDQCVSSACLSMKREKSISFISLFAALKCVSKVTRYAPRLLYYI
jgi:hypothetical protein